MKKIFTLMVVAALTAMNYTYAQQTFSGLVGDTVYFDLGAPRGAIQWEKSSDNSTYTAEAGQTSDTLVYVIDALPIYFRAIITDGECDPITSPYIEVNSSVNPPTVTTATVTNITQTTADGGGNVTSDGGSAILARGLCYNTTGSPTISDLTTNASGTTGAFTSQMTNLNPGTLYYVRAWAANAQGTSYGAEVQFITTGGYNIGDTGPGGGKIFYLNGQGGGMEVDLTDEVGTGAGGREVFGCSGSTLGASGTLVGTGVSNTATIVANCNDANFAAKLCDNATSGSQNDWVLPSIDELDSIYVNLVNITTPAITINTLDNYWSSSESGTSFAQTYNFGFGQIAPTSQKSNDFRVRCVREF